MGMLRDLGPTWPEHQVRRNLVQPNAASVLGHSRALGHVAVRGIRTNSQRHTGSSIVPRSCSTFGDKTVRFYEHAPLLVRDDEELFEAIARAKESLRDHGGACVVFLKDADTVEKCVQQLRKSSSASLDVLAKNLLLRMSIASSPKQARRAG